MNVRTLLLLVLSTPFPCVATELPSGFELKQSETGEASLLKDGKVIIHPNIVLLGSNKNYIVGCVEGEKKDVNIPKNIFPGYFIYPIATGEMAQVISKQNWEWFKEKNPELATIKLFAVAKGECSYAYTE